MARSKPYRWIDNEIATLDPLVDYATIWKLGHSYRTNEFLMSLLYTNSLPILFSAFKSSRAVLRGGKGKVYTKPIKRMDDSNRAVLTWWDNGPDSVITKRIANAVNKMHVHYEKMYPGDFRNNEDFIFVLCYFAAGLHLVRVRVGLAGYNEKMKVAAWKFWNEMAGIFLLGGDGDGLINFPADFDAILAFIAEIENRGWTHNEHGPDLVERAIVPFVQRYFPKPLYGVGRALVLGLAPDSRLQALGVQPATRFQKWFARQFVKLGIFLSERILPDPELTLLERYELQSTKPARLSYTFYSFFFFVATFLVTYYFT